MIKTSFIESSKKLLIKFESDLLSTKLEEYSRIIQLAIDQHQNIQLLDIDLNTIDMMDSLGLNLLVNLAKLSSRKKIKAKLYVTDPTIHRVLMFSRMDKVIEIGYGEEVI